MEDKPGPYTGFPEGSQIERFVKSLKTTCTRCGDKHPGWCEDLVFAAVTREWEVAQVIERGLRDRGYEQSYSDMSIDDNLQEREFFFVLVDPDYDRFEIEEHVRKIVDGMISEITIKKGDTVTIKKGTRIRMPTAPDSWPKEVTAKKDYKIKVNRMSAYGVCSARMTHRSVLREFGLTDDNYDKWCHTQIVNYPFEVCWAGRGRYWAYARVKDIKE